MLQDPQRVAAEDGGDFRLAETGRHQRLGQQRPAAGIEDRGGGAVEVGDSPDARLGQRADLLFAAHH